MFEYQILKQGLFENRKRFLQRINDLAREGWRAVSAAADRTGQNIVLMEKEMGSRYS